MKGAKKIFNASLMICLCLAGACSNPGSYETSAGGINSSKDLQSNLELTTFESDFTLGQNGSIILSYDNTHLILIKSYVIANCQIDKRDLHITTSNQVGNNSLPCQWKEQGSFAFEDLTIKNVSGQVKNFKVYLAGYTLAGSDNGLTSPVKSTLSDNTTVSTDELPLDSLKRSLRLKPYQTYSFTYANTGFRVFRSLNAPNCKELQNTIQITGYADDEAFLIECGSNNFAAFEIKIQNLTSGFADLDLTLTGSRKLVNPIHLTN